MSRLVDPIEAYQGTLDGLTQRAIDEVEAAYMRLKPDPKNNRQTWGAAAVWAFMRGSRWDMFEPERVQELRADFMRSLTGLRRVA